MLPGKYFPFLSPSVIFIFRDVQSSPIKSLMVASGKPQFGTLSISEGCYDWI